MNNVIVLGLISFFADFSTEMVYPLIPLYLTVVLGASPALVGVIEGIAESLASLLKVFSGYVSDRFGKKKPLAFAGYATGLVYKVALLLANSWWGVLAARVIDRFGKGVRTAPRDVMVAECATQGNAGRTFGIHKALDMAGTALGTLAAFALLSLLGDESYRTVFAVSMVPMVVALGLFGLVKEKTGRPEPKPREAFWKNLRGLDRQLKLYLVVAFLFTLGNSSNTFLLLRASDVGFTSTSVILMYFVYNLVASLLAVPLGGLSDRVGRKRVLVAGYLTFALAYACFAAASSPAGIGVAFAVYGVYTALVAGVERAFIAEIAPTDLKGTMLGLHSTVVGVALLPASVIAGALWTALGPTASFGLGAALALAAALTLQLGLKGGRQARVEA